MHVFVDDSGDPGFKLHSGSTHYFVIACCVFATPQAAETTAQAIRDFKNSLGWSQNQEFKFSKTSKDKRLSFMEAIYTNDFFVRAIVINKHLINSHNLQNNHKNFYNYAIKSVLSRSAGTIQNAVVKIDGGGSRDYKIAVRNYLKSEANTQQLCIVKDVKFVNSKNDQLIQLADMVAGSIRRGHDPSGRDKSDYSTAIQTICRRDKSDIWIFK